jgi:hypothetical protein
MEKTDVFVQNVHVNGIKVSVSMREGGNAFQWEKVFPIQTFDYNGRELTTGYTRLDAREYEICRRDKLFQYFQGIGKLIVTDGLPSSAMTPHEALTGARKQIRALQEELAAVQSAYRAALTELRALGGGTGGEPVQPEKPAKRGGGGKKQEKAAAPADPPQPELVF